MGKRVKIAPILREHLQIPGIIEIHGDTVKDCLDDLIRQYPGIRCWLFERNDLLRVLISLNNKEILNLNKESETNRILKPDDEIRILAIYSGG